MLADEMTFAEKMICTVKTYVMQKDKLLKSFTSSPKIVEYEPEAKSVTVISVVLFLTVRSFSSDATNLAKNKCQENVQYLNDNEKYAYLDTAGQ